MYQNNIQNVQKLGYSIIPSVYSKNQIEAIGSCIHSHTNNLEEKFAIRQVLKVIPELKPFVFTENLKQILKTNFSSSCFVSKAIYFNKPANSNWFVSYHQDISISVKEKIDIKAYTRWTKKHNQYGVIPPIHILNNILTIRIHLDETTKENGALRVIPKSHLNGFIRPETINFKTLKEVVCEANPGDVLLMKPLTLHASDKTINNKARRILHLEFSSYPLDEPLQWLEKEPVI